MKIQSHILVIIVKELIFPRKPELRVRGDHANTEDFADSVGLVRRSGE